MDVASLRHPKEKLYFALTAAISGLVWLCFLGAAAIQPAALAGPVSLVLTIACSLWLAGKLLSARLLGNAALVGPEQFPELHKMVLDGCQALGLQEVPRVFVVNGDGAINAFAMRFGGSQVVLLSGLVDMMVAQQMGRELKMVICHELGHHAAGHVSTWKGIFLMWGKLMPYLGPAYSRACEFTADRLGAACVGDLTAAKRGLVAIAVGSHALKTNLNAFAAQEQQIGSFFGRMSEVYASHPRMTRRVLALDEIADRLPKRPRRQASAPLTELEATVG